MKTITVFLFGALLIAACTKTITPSLNTVPPQLVIQGAVSDTAGPYQVLISSSVNFYADNVFPSISGATVTITDSTRGTTDQLTETTPGVYTTHSTTGTPGNTYLLQVLVNGKTYTASSTMPRPVALDSVSFDASDNKQIRAQANYPDPVGIVNHYKYSLNINGVRDQRFQTFDDRLSDGRYIRDKIDADTSEIKRNDVVELFLVGVDKGVYTWLRDAENVAYSNDNLVAPATPQSNITGGCLGYFSAQTVSRRSATVKY
jgi:hypothetical protein